MLCCCLCFHSHTFCAYSAFPVFPSLSIPCYTASGHPSVRNRNAGTQICTALYRIHDCLSRFCIGFGSHRAMQKSSGNGGYTRPPRKRCKQRKETTKMMLRETRCEIASVRVGKRWDRRKWKERAMQDADVIRIEPTESATRQHEREGSKKGWETTKTMTTREGRGGTLGESRATYNKVDNSSHSPSQPHAQLTHRRFLGTETCISRPAWQPLHPTQDPNAVHLEPPGPYVCQSQSYKWAQAWPPICTCGVGVPSYCIGGAPGPPGGAIIIGYGTACCTK